MRSEVGEVFGSWSDLARAEKRPHRRNLQTGVWGRCLARRIFKIDRLEIGLFPSDLGMYN
jgi:hypothetical protein